MEERQGIPSYLIYIGIFVVVFVVALGVFLYNSQTKAKDFNTESYKYKPSEVQEADASSNTSPSPTTNEALKVTIATPEDESFLNSNSIKVAGASKPGTTISIVGGAKDVVGESNSDGSFALDTPLKEGENQLIITVYDQSGQQKSVTKTVYVLMEG